MERPPDIPAEMWHDEPPEVVLRAVEEMARFYWEMGMRFDEREETLPPDWRDRMKELLPNPDIQRLCAMINPDEKLAAKGTMSTLELILEKAKDLSPEGQRAILDFIELVKTRQSERRLRVSAEGLCADLGIDLSGEEIDEARREIWADFPRENI